MVPELPVRRPGATVPNAVRDAAVRAGRRGLAIDPLVLRRVRDALVQLPGTAMGWSCLQIPGDCLASPGSVGAGDDQLGRQGLRRAPWPSATGYRKDGT